MSDDGAWKGESLCYTCPTPVSHHRNVSCRGDETDPVMSANDAVCLLYVSFWWCACFLWCRRAMTARVGPLSGARQHRRPAAALARPAFSSPTSPRTGQTDLPMAWRNVQWPVRLSIARCRTPTLPHRVYRKHLATPSCTVTGRGV